MVRAGTPAAASTCRSPRRFLSRASIRAARTRLTGTTRPTPSTGTARTSSTPAASVKSATRREGDGERISFMDIKKTTHVYYYAESGKLSNKGKVCKKSTAETICLSEICRLIALCFFLVQLDNGYIIAVNSSALSIYVFPIRTMAMLLGDWLFECSRATREGGKGTWRLRAHPLRERHAQ